MSFVPGSRSSSLAAFFLVLSLSAPVVAQETTVTATPVTAATEVSDETTTTVGPTTTVPGTNPDGTTAVTNPDGTPAVTNPDGTPVVTNPDGTPVVTGDDKGAGEEPPDQTPPTIDLTVPPRGLYDGQAQAPVSQVLVSNVKEARAKLKAAEQAHNEAIALVKVLRLRQKALQVERDQLDTQTKETLAQLQAAEERMSLRALMAFVEGGSSGLSGSLSSAVDSDAALEYEARQTLVETVFETDEEVIAEYDRLREALDAQTLGLFDRERVVNESMAGAVATVDEKAAEIEQAKRELESFEAGSQIYVEGVIFPIQWPYEVPLIDSWGFPRMTGTADAHWHEGIDLFAPAGTPLLATERGIVTKIGSGRLGGLRLWLRGESGTDWYYAHLSAFAPKLSEGQVVEAGELLGYVGNTGNAVGTPPHLHMQVHPNGGDPVNPYPLLKVVSDRELAVLEGVAAERD